MMGQYQLTMRTGPNPGTVYALEGEQISIGRDASNDITVNDAEVSRNHRNWIASPSVIHPSSRHAGQKRGI